MHLQTELSETKMRIECDKCISQYFGRRIHSWKLLACLTESTVKLLQYPMSNPALKLLKYSLFDKTDFSPSSVADQLDLSLPKN